MSVEENGAVFGADILAGQKTGWFFDQRDNRAFVAGLRRERGSSTFTAIRAASRSRRRAPARRQCWGSTARNRALALAAASAERNGVAGICEFRRAEVFAEAAALAAAGERFDVVIADPPAFARSKRDAPAALRGYRKLARLAAGLAAPGGFVFLASCWPPLLTCDDGTVSDPPISAFSVISVNSGRSGGGRKKAWAAASRAIAF